MGDSGVQYPLAQSTTYLSDFPAKYSFKFSTKRSAALGKEKVMYVHRVVCNKIVFQCAKLRLSRYIYIASN